MAQIERTGVLSFGDASLSIWEEGISEARKAGGRDGEKAWKLKFKREVFARIVQTLNRLGWTLTIPQDYIKQYSVSFARNHRECSKGDLKGWLEICGRTIKFETWQGINTPTRPDHGGRYEWNKESCMPYVLRLEMERTRRRIRDYLCSVLSGYTFNEEHRTIYRKPMQFTALERIKQHYAESIHFDGDMASYLKRNHYEELPDYNCTNRAKERISHGQRVWFADRKGRVCEGTAYYNINSMWWVVTGRYDYNNLSVGELHTKCPDLPRIKRNTEQRRNRLEKELKKAVAAMDFMRAQTLKNILYPEDPDLYAIWHKGHKAFFAVGYCGYRNNLDDAGHYTREELKPYLGSKLEDDQLKAVRIGKTTATDVAESAVTA